MNILQITYGTIEIAILSAAVISISIIAAVCIIITIISAGKHEEQSILRLPSGKGQNEVMNFSEHSDFYSSPVLIRRQSQYTKSCFNTNGKNQSGTF